MVPLRYRRTRLTAIQCLVVGRCINWDNLLTTKEMSGQVNERYCKAPVIFRYSVASASGEPPARQSIWVELIGVDTSLESSIFERCSKSQMYFCCDRNTPLAVIRASIPRKYPRDPRSLRAKRAASLQMNWSRRVFELPVTMRSST